jgi:hypothetical protein
MSKVEYVPFGTVEKLVEHIERMFDCQNGDYRAWHTALDGGEHLYSCIAIIAPASREDSQERLRQVIYSAFLKLKQTCKSERPVLYWRFASPERIQECAETDLERQTTPRHKIRTRVAIPEADFSILGGWVFKDGDTIMELSR